ncbi:MAG: HD domain-containing protein [Anaerolineae bacterium]|nr:HD domain-containing protein [Anaerolineae bacterium]
MVVHHIAPDGAELFELISTYLDPEARDLVRRAFEFARQHHGDDLRKSGELYITHPLTIAYYLAEYQLDAPALAAALLHDIVEDTVVSVEEIRERFGPEVASLVDGLTKFMMATGDDVPAWMSLEAARDATLHKLFRVMTDDLRVGIIKLFDRLHNMRTIEATDAETQRRKAEETLAVYAPLANRLGMWQLKNELEGRSLRILDPVAYETIHNRLEQLRHQHQRVFARISPEIATDLTSAGLEVVDMLLCPQNVHTVYRSARSNGHHGNHFSFDDTPRFVVVLKDEAACYLALGRIHQLWRPVPGKFDDYIANPRDNLYRSLHTTVVHSSGKRIKIRFRTAAMNVLSEVGVLARWLHTGLPLWSEEISQRVNVLVDNISDSIEVEPEDAQSGVQALMEDVFRDQIVVYTPKGDVKELPKGATPLDFAYTIHSEVGAKCRMAFVNEEPTALNAPLADGDRVRIVKKGDAPQRIWLDEDLGFLTTNKARARVRRWFRRLPVGTAISEGKRLLKDELEMLGLADLAVETVAEWLDYDSPTNLYHALGRADVLPTALSTRVLEETWEQGPRRNIGSVVTSEEGERFIIIDASGHRLRLCRTCRPRPNDELIGIARGSQRVTIHRVGCRMLPLDPRAERTLKFSWGSADQCEVRLVRVRVDVYDRSGLLYEIADLLKDERINMPSVHAESYGGKAIVHLDMEVASPRQLVRVLHRMQALVNVYEVTCLHTDPHPQ